MISSVSQRSGLSGLFADRPYIYLVVVFVSAIVAAAFGFRQSSLFACQPVRYPSEAYVGYCQSSGYADYDYGAFWFNLEPDAVRAAADAEVLFLGNSRMQFGFSSDALDAWFKSTGTRYYLLGFAYEGNYLFAEPMLGKLGSNARVYVVNLDRFFEQEQTPPAKAVLYDRSAEARYGYKRRQQRVHHVVCSHVPALCGDDLAFYRSRATGRWKFGGGRSLVAAPVSYEERIDPAVVATYASSARDFLATLPVPAQCQILTFVPAVATTTNTAREIAQAVERTFIAPDLGGLRTFDASHLDAESAERWSTEFLRQAGPRIEKCLGVTSSSADTSSK